MTKTETIVFRPLSSQPEMPTAHPNVHEQEPGSPGVRIGRVVPGIFAAGADLSHARPYPNQPYADPAWPHPDQTGAGGTVARQSRDRLYGPAPQPKPVYRHS